ncbi:transporter substrate-binding domain-containing protein [Iodobacter sp. CM08]|uniref:transporter substrate-binding domain-containing protein n=1 Tax=Iodobacter sp. CM08 TaxID=3085902 RepID=UPI002981B915|nr:transporter substrate-binding domain-containing protein [Iodobacter sp. CM08]MDW5415850.1 transporter substrate-binding domain-containing protein [Iodobacter sp. CM08]
MDKLLLSEHVFSTMHDVPLDEQDSRWLRAKKILKLGVALPDVPPFGITTYEREFSGVTADYIGVIAESLGVRVEVYHYANQALLLDALKAGEVDLLDGSDFFYSSDGAYIFSDQYIENNLVVVSRKKEERHFPGNLSGVSIAAVPDYIPFSVLKSKYSSANFKSFSSVSNALGAVAFGSADVMIIDLISANYLINNDFYNYLELNGLSEIDLGNYGCCYVFGKNNTKLQRIINAALKSITEEEKAGIARRWNGNGINLGNKNKITLTESEKRWINKNPVVTIDVGDYIAPISYFDINGGLQGVLGDVLNKIKLNTGLTFKISRSSSLSDTFSKADDGDIDVFAPLSRSLSLRKKFIFSRPIFYSQYVFVVKKGMPRIDDLSNFDGLKLAVVDNVELIEILKRKYPKIKLANMENALEALGFTATGKVDATVVTLPRAEYYIHSLFENELYISSMLDLGDEQIQYQPAFAVKKDAIELLAILDKALAAIPVEERSMIRSRWQAPPMVSSGRWLDHKSLIYSIIVLVFFIIVIFVIWNLRLAMIGKQRTAAHRVLLDKLNLLAGAMNGAPFPIYIVGADGVLQFCNDFFLNKIGLTRESLIGKADNADVLISLGLNGADGLRALNVAFQRVLSDEVAVDCILSWEVEDSMMICRHWMLPCLDSRGAIQGVACCYVDVTEREQLISGLKDAKELADCASKAKTTFLATMSHEIRTPMNAIIGMLELALKKADRNVLDRSAIEVAYGSAQSLLELIGDILDVVRIESGSLSLAPTRGHLRELVESVVRVFDGLARQKGLSLVVDLDVSINRDVLLDPLRFKQVLSNLIGNAIKFTHKGRVDIQVLGKPIDDVYLQVQLLVKDSGIGISKKDQERLFQPFIQANNNGQSTRIGAGLGLMISRELCELMGGGLELTSELGVGTQVQVSLTFNVLEPVLSAQGWVEQGQQEQKPLTVLVVDDHAANRLLLCEQLIYLGHGVRSAEDGAEGLSVWKANHFDVVITDCNMPVMSGYELTQAIRKAEKISQLPPCRVLGYTANAQEEEREHCKAVGMDDCMFKPVGVDDLAKYLTSSALSPVLFLGEGERDYGEVKIEQLMRLTGNNPKLVARFLNELINNNRDDLVTLLNLSDVADTVGLGGLAHKIKGAAQVVNAGELMRSCEVLEALCKCAHQPEELAAAVFALEESILALESLLLSYINSGLAEL